MRSEGLSNDPLKRTIFTQFLLDGTYGDTNRQALYGLSPDQLGGVSEQERYGIGEGNPYADYLKSYKAFTPGRTVGLIHDVIRTLQSDIVWKGGDAVKGYSPEQIRGFRWLERFGSGTNAIQNQQALAAMPIMRATPALLQDETSRILNMLYQRWQADPDKDDNIGWLEHVYRNKFFGLAGDISQEWGGTTWDKGSAWKVGERPAGAGPYDYPPAPEKTEVIEKVPDEQSTNPVTKAKIVIPENVPNEQAVVAQEGLTFSDIQGKVSGWEASGDAWSEFGDPEGRTVTDFMLKYQTSKEQEAGFQGWSREPAEAALFQKSKMLQEIDDLGRRHLGWGHTQDIGYDRGLARSKFEDWVSGIEPPFPNR